MRRTIAHLLDDAPVRRDFAWQVRVERLAAIDTLRTYARGNLRPRDVVGGDWVGAALKDVGLLRIQPHLERRGMTYDQRRATDRVARLSARAVSGAPREP